MKALLIIINWTKEVKKYKMIKNKKAGFEMSITTLVVIVIAVVMLILGLVFVRQIFGTATESVNTIDDQVKNELMNLFGEEGGKEIVVKLGTQQTAKVRQGTEGFGFVFGIAPEGITNLNQCKYTITKSGGNCNNPDPATWFVYGMTNLAFDEISQNTAFALVKLNIPRNQQPCQQKFTIQATCGSWSRTTFFNIDVISRGFF